MRDNDSFNDQMILLFHLKIFASKFLKKTNLDYKTNLTFKQRNSQKITNTIFFTPLTLNIFYEGFCVATKPLSLV